LDGDGRCSKERVEKFIGTCARFSVEVSKQIVLAGLDKDKDSEKKRYFDDLLQVKDMWLLRMSGSLDDHPTKDEVLELFHTEGITSTSDLRLSILGLAAPKEIMVSSLQIPRSEKIVDKNQNS